MKSFIIKFRTIFLFLAFTILTFTVYIFSLKNGFVSFDDPPILLLNQAVKDFNLKKIFLEMNSGDYLPLTYLTYAIENFFFGMNPFYFHLTNMTLHAFNVILVAIVVGRITQKNIFVMTLVAILFSVHPLHVESVAWISERKDVLCTFFFLSALLAYFRYFHSKKIFYYVLSLLLFLASMGSKVMAVTFPFIIWLTEYSYLGRLQRKSILRGLPFIFVAFLFGLKALSIHGTAKIIHMRTFETLNPLSNFISSVLFYLSKSVVPVRLSAFYERGAAHLGVLDYLLALSVVALLYFGYRFVKSKEFQISKGLISPPNLELKSQYQWAFGFFVITLLPMAQIIPFGRDFIYADRFFYIPSIGLFLMFGILLDAFWWQQRALAISFLFLALGVFSILSIERTKVWANSEVLWQDVLQKYPNTSTAYYNLGVDRYSKGSIMEAENYFKKAIEINPAYINAHNNLAIVYGDKRQWDLAIIEYKKIVEINPKDASGHFNLGNVYIEVQDFSQAIKEFELAQELDPQNPQIFFGLGNIYGRGGNLDKAEEYLKKGLLLDSNSAQAHHNLGNVYYGKNQLAEAFLEYRKALALNPSMENSRQLIEEINFKLNNRTDKLLSPAINNGATKEKKKSPQR